MSNCPSCNRPLIGVSHGHSVCEGGHRIKLLPEDKRSLLTSEQQALLANYHYAHVRMVEQEALLIKVAESSSFPLLIAAARSVVMELAACVLDLRMQIRDEDLEDLIHSGS